MLGSLVDQSVVASISNITSTMYEYGMSGVCLLDKRKK
jgi:hypothetical protein